MFFNNAKVKAQIGYGQVSTANSDRDGTGTLTKLFTGQSPNGSYVASIVVKAQNTTTPGMVRIFIKEGGNTYLFEEFSVYATEPSGVLETYQSMLVIPGGLFVPQDVEIWGSTENGEVFDITVNGFTWDYCPC